MKTDTIPPSSSPSAPRAKFRQLRKWLHWVGRSALAPERFL